MKNQKIYITRKEAQEILGGMNQPLFVYHITKNKIQHKEEKRNGRLFYLYSKDDILKLKEKLEKRA